MIYAYLQWNCENIPSTVMFYRVITLNLRSYIQALNLSVSSSLTEEKKKNTFAL